MAVDVSIFHTVHVVSIEAVTIRLGDFSFHEKFVNGAPADWFCTFDCPDNAVFIDKLCPEETGGWRNIA